MTRTLPDCPKCDAARSVEVIDQHPGWFYCTCCATTFYVRALRPTEATQPAP
jgi:isoleucyl-tRNA synthetase